MLLAQSCAEVNVQPSAETTCTCNRKSSKKPDQLNVDLVERPVVSIEALRAGLRALRPGEADAFFYVTDAMMTSQSRLVIDEAMARKMATMFIDSGSARQGALFSYGVSYYVVGRASAKQVQRVLLGAAPADLPVEQVDRVHFVINLKTAKALGLTIPPSVLLRADQVIE